ncbi:hypothetical protein N7492_005926 [Penicillium capsulatum]|uniref:Uncharacterized protein n=1 Tax=Penicillium capsulatum TaxID=69766 RepID=A0A9W9LSL5_9EURO|nr:hypothetical protein N7492_005926 [Penicillium capsulatum]KAJ6134971.1 hypothetical protein N7512_000131 [Penicillium capsulatum]
MRIHGFRHGVSSPMPSFPPPDAGPAQVRAYLVDVLLLYHDTSLEFAQQIADLWHLGRGVDLRQAASLHAKDTFTHIFGDAVGPFLERSVREQLVLDWRTSMPGVLVYWGLIGLPVLGVLLLLRAWKQPTSDKMGAALGPVFWALGPPLCLCGILGHNYTSLGGIGLSVGTVGSCLLLMMFVLRWQDVTVQESREKSKI